jgi:hypothetical protein
MTQNYPVLTEDKLKENTVRIDVSSKKSLTCPVEVTRI